MYAVTLIGPPWKLIEDYSFLGLIESLFLKVSMGQATMMIENHFVWQANRMGTPTKKKNIYIFFWPILNSSGTGSVRTSSQGLSHSCSRLLPNKRFLYFLMDVHSNVTEYFVTVFHTDVSVYPSPVAGLRGYSAVAAYSFSSKLFTRYSTDHM